MGFRASSLAQNDQLTNIAPSSKFIEQPIDTNEVIDINMYVGMC